MERDSFPQPKKPEAPQRVEQHEGNLRSFEKLRTVIGRVAQEVNSMMKEKHGISKFVEPETCCVRADRYSNKHSGGIYIDEVVQADLKKVEDLDKKFVSADNERVQQHFSKTYNIPATAEAVVAQHRKNKEESNPGQTEMAITALLHKMLKGRFVVVRASTYDDYMNEMDNLILDTETGAVICAFDEVLLNEGDDPNNSIKLKKITDIALEGGKKAKYGLALEGDKIVRSGLQENVPVFYLELKRSDLNKLASDLLENFDKEPTALEQKLYALLVASIEEQKKILEGLALRPGMKNKLEAFEESLEVLKGYSEKK